MLARLFLKQINWKKTKFFINKRKKEQKPQPTEGNEIKKAINHKYAIDWPKIDKTNNLKKSENETKNWSVFKNGQQDHVFATGQKLFSWKKWKKREMGRFSAFGNSFYVKLTTEPKLIRNRVEKETVTKGSILIWQLLKKISSSVLKMDRKRKIQ